MLAYYSLKNQRKNQEARKKACNQDHLPKRLQLQRQIPKQRRKYNKKEQYLTLTQAHVQQAIRTADLSRQNQQLRQLVEQPVSSSRFAATTDASFRRRTN